MSEQIKSLKSSVKAYVILLASSVALLVLTIASAYIGNEALMAVFDILFAICLLTAFVWSGIVLPIKIMLVKHK